MTMSSQELAASTGIAVMKKAMDVQTELASQLISNLASIVAAEMPEAFTMSRYIDVFA